MTPRSNLWLNIHPKHLWAHSVEAQIAEMRKIYNSLEEKPEWLTKEDIDSYETRMTEASTKTVVAFPRNNPGTINLEELRNKFKEKEITASADYIAGTLHINCLTYNDARGVQEILNETSPNFSTKHLTNP